jgi:hypothetical protein
MANNREGNREVEYREVLRFRRHNDTILMSEVSILTALTSGLLYAYGRYISNSVSIGIAWVGLLSTGAFLFLMLRMVYGAEARDERARRIEEDLGFRHMRDVHEYFREPGHRRLYLIRSRYIVGIYGILLIVTWFILLIKAL